MTETTKFGLSLPPKANEPVGAVLTPMKDGPAFLRPLPNAIGGFPAVK